LFSREIHFSHVVDAISINKMNKSNPSEGNQRPGRTNSKDYQDAPCLHSRVFALIIICLNYSIKRKKKPLKYLMYFQWRNFSEGMTMKLMKSFGK
jgi:hypothetical protein